MGFFRRRGPKEMEVALLSGSTPLEVVGESFCQEDLRLVEETLGRDVVAVLNPEPKNEYDANAVAVLVGGRKVGHLSRPDAAKYQPQILRLMKAEQKPIAVVGRIVGGDEDRPTLGIWLSHDPSDFFQATPAASGSPPLPGSSAPAEVSSPPVRDQSNSDRLPYEDRFNRARRAQRDISELLGLCKGFLVDGELSDSEIRALDDWINSHADATEDWIVAQIVRRVRSILEDGVVSAEERADLSEILGAFTGGTAELVLGEDPRSTGLPLDAPAPDVQWAGSVFVFTGKFAFGPRIDCERVTEARGGVTDRDITKRTHYLVIGTFGSKDWIHSSYGRKIQKAAKYRESGTPLAIVCEDHWRKWLN